MIRVAIKIVLRLSLGVLYFLDFATSNTRNQITKIFGKIQSEKVLIHVSWNPSIEPGKDEVALIKSFKNQGYQVLVCVNVDKSSPRKNEQIMNSWSALTDALILRKNKGRDLAGVRDAVTWISKKGLHISQIVISNNSVYWLPNKLDHFVLKVLNTSNPIFAATDSHSPFHHFQTFLFGANGEGIKLLETQLRKVRNTRLRRTAVIYGELALNWNLEKQKTHFYTIFSYKNLLANAIADLSFPQIISTARAERLKNVLKVESEGIALNPTHHLWFELYSAGFPGIKKDLLKKNPSGIIDLPTIHQMLNKQDSEALAGGAFPSSRGYRNPERFGLGLKKFL